MPQLESTLKTLCLMEEATVHVLYDPIHIKVQNRELIFAQGWGCGESYLLQNGTGFLSEVTKVL